MFLKKISFEANGRHIVSGGHEGTVNVWDFACVTGVVSEPISKPSSGPGTAEMPVGVKSSSADSSAQESPAHPDIHEAIVDGGLFRVSFV